MNWMERDCSWEEIQKMLAKAEDVIDENMAGLERKEDDELIELRNKIKEDRNEFQERCRRGLGAGEREEIMSKFALAELKIATVFYNRKDKTEFALELIKKFKGEEFKLINDLEKFNIFGDASLTPERIVEGIVRREKNIYPFVKKYVEEQYVNLDSLMEKQDIDKYIRAGVRKHYERYLGKIKTAVMMYIQEHPGTWIMVFREIEEAIIKVLEVEQKRLQIEKEVNERILSDVRVKELESQLENIKNQRDNIEKNMIELERASMSKEFEKNDLLNKLDMLKKENENLAQISSKVVSDWNSKFAEIENMKKELMNKEMELLQEREKAKEEAKKIVDEELNALKNQKRELELKLQNYEDIKEKQKNDIKILEEKIKEHRDSLERGQVKRLVLRDEAVADEIDYIGRFDKKISENSEFYNRETDENIKVPSLSYNIYNFHFDKRNEIYNALAENLKEEINRIPTCPTSRYEIVKKRLFAEDERVMIVEARILNHWRFYGQLGLDTRTATLAELNDIVREVVNNSNYWNCYWVVCVASATGWDEKAINFAREFMQKNVSLLLLDLENGAMYCNRADEGIMKYLKIFEREFDVEKKRKCRDKIFEKKKDRRGVSLTEMVEEGYPRNIVKKVFHDLEDEKYGKILVDGKELIFRWNLEEE